MCLTYDWTTGCLRVSATNGYLVARGYSYFLGGAFTFSACAGIDTVRIVCATFYY